MQLLCISGLQMIMSTAATLIWQSYASNSELLLVSSMRICYLQQVIVDMLKTFSTTKHPHAYLWWRLLQCCAIFMKMCAFTTKIMYVNSRFSQKLVWIEFISPIHKGLYIKMLNVIQYKTYDYLRFMSLCF